jgi:serine/threonine-protein kinase
MQSAAGAIQRRAFMDTNTWQRIEAVFFGALELEKRERDAFLDAACAADPELRREVEAMLAVHADDSGMRVERVLLRMGDGASADPPERMGQRVGPWRLERLLGQGGMGEVWLASRADGEFEQLAAVKLVRPGWLAAQLIPRFRRERQLLARLQHPNIATLLDGGLTQGGFPYLAMEFVDGEPVTEWCAARNFSIRDRLVLFGTICEAVRFAHSNLVVHRDLKPQNILVTKSGRPVLLDFGIATLIGPEYGEQFATREGDRVLTPEHAAPEQLRGEPATTATDVWALGVLLYELLSGVRPFTGRDCTPTELERRVLHDDPPPPSAASRGKEAARVLRGDLDRIVMKALQKETSRRYRSAEDFNEDIHRWLHGLPVRATPDSLAITRASSSPEIAPPSRWRRSWECSSFRSVPSPCGRPGASRRSGMPPCPRAVNRKRWSRCSWTSSSWRIRLRGRAAIRSASAISWIGPTRSSWSRKRLPAFERSFGGRLLKCTRAAAASMRRSMLWNSRWNLRGNPASSSIF